MSAIKSKNLRKGLQQLVLMQPFWGTLALHMDFVEKPDHPTLATDGKRIFYNKGFVDDLSVGLNTFCIAHEVSHPFLQHLTRPFKPHGRDSKTWGRTKDGKVYHFHPTVYNCAGDHVINLMLEAAGFQIWPKALKDKKYASMTTEQVYWDIMPKNPPPPPPQGGGGKGEKGEEGEKEEGDCETCGGEGEDSDGEECPDCGGSGERADSSGGSGGYDALPQPDPITGYDLDPSVGPAEDFNEQEFTEIVTKAASIAKAQGKLPGSMTGLIKEATEPQYPVYMLLERFIDSALMDEDTSFKRPHKHFMNRGIVMPGYYSERVSHVVLAYDTSGSVPDSDLARFHRVGGDIIRRLKPKKLSVVQCDARVTDWQDVERASDWPREIKCKGRGGTRFEPVFEEVKKRRAMPSCLVYLTDLCGSFPSPPPNYPTLWISTEGGQAPFGLTITFNDRDRD